ncbi:MAG: hypothetical protein SAJ12_03615 [Jaaginema sp. PMC 1079.18]|nr:hypothetical protein [Jaaginema sp. PMC 1080.18]MEC4850077.1 hypothetical protein [Jaaginema sp. PMC 1079.18]MEC4867558.1 hypothetical protein [Jaaginema sp. PMC 1078.18]
MYWTRRITSQNLDQLLERGCDWLEAYFTTHPEERLEVCEK